MKFTRFVLSILFIIAVISLAACGGAPPSEGEGGAPSSNTPVGGESPPPTRLPSPELSLDPANATGENARALVRYLYEGLVRMDGNNVVGALAESYTVSEDGLDYIFNLRPGVTFHDGTALTADVMIANFNRWFDPNDPNRGSGEFAAWRTNFGGFKGDVTAEGKPLSIYDGIEKVDDMTVLVHLNTPDPDFLKKLTDPAFSIVSPQAFDGGDGGSGPYRFAGLSGSTVTLEPFPGYWNPSAIPSSGMDVPLK